ncbi:MAG: hypothetical protein HC884_19305 [Chloroflexaceae bacterium]|nr:hypothetical protein [Chloroflexaceae bacterium]
MQTLPFQKIRTLEHMLLNEVVMDDLVVVLSKHDSDQCLLVYNTETDDDLPPPPHPDHRVARLGTLYHADYANFDGPVIGLSAVDVILSGVPTHGINFYPIERIFRQKNQLEPFLRTSYRLACTLARHLAGLRGVERERKNHRGHTKIIQLSLPLLLGRHPLDNLVAVLPSKDLRVFLDLDHQGYQLIYNRPTPTHDREWLRTSSPDHSPDFSPWVAMFEEASLFHPSLSRVVRRPVDLRTVLRQMDQADLLEATGRRLAQRCWNEWEATGSPALRDAAYTLATEAWLVDEDVEGLVALFPNEDFSRFVETGDALRIYRALDPTASREPSALGPRHSMEDLLLKRIDYPAYATTPVAFPVLASVLRRISTEPVLDLAPILWKANHGTSLARMFWLLSRDLLERPIPEWAQIGAKLAAITDLVVRATLIYSLNDPWQWRGGRHGLFLRNCYRHLDRCLQEQSLTSEELKYYYTALREWYGCFISDDDESSLNRMVQACRNLHDSVREQYERLDYVRTADHLLEIGASIVQPGHRGRFRLQEGHTTEWKSEEIAEFLSTIVHSSTPTQVPSPVLGQFLHLYFDIHDRWKRLQEQAFSHRPSTDDMDALLAELTNAQRVIHAPAHEMVVLLRAFNRDIEHIHRLKQSMGSGAIIKVALQNPWITLDVQETLVVNVQNLGSAGASQFRLGLDRSRGFEFLTEPHPLELPVLAPGERRRLEYRVRVKEPLLMLTFSYRYRNSTGQLYADQQHIRVEAQQRAQDVRRFTRLNPFEVGRPVSGGDHFFGRRKELEKILTRLARGSTQPLVLRGPRRIGKSSLLRQLTRILTDRQERQALGFSPELQSQISVIHPGADRPAIH